MYQKTVASSVNFSGIGGHSGVNINLSIKPACSGNGIVFHRTDLDERIIASYKNVSDTRLCTVISNNGGASVSTIEHLMSALYAFGIDNAIIEVDGPELPILDGSALEYTKKFKECGVKNLGAAKRYIKVLKKVCVEVDGKRLSITPASHFCASVEINFAHPIIGNQKFEYDSKHNTYDCIASARTFCFKKDLEQLQAIGLAKGASLEHGIGLSDDGILNKGGLRFQNEFVRHKILDLIGDLALGGNIIGRVDGFKIGHTINNTILHKLFSDTENYTITHYNYSAAEINNENIQANIGNLVHVF